MSKADAAFRTIGELATELAVPQHVLRYWETKFPQLRPLQRAGNRRYYRPEDVALVRRIDRLLNHEGYTVRGVQKLLDEGGAPAAVPVKDEPAATPVLAPDRVAPGLAAPDLAALRALRDQLAAALAEDEAA